MLSELSISLEQFFCAAASIGGFSSFQKRFDDEINNAKKCNSFCSRLKLKGINEGR